MAVERPQHDDEGCLSGTPCFRCHIGSLTLGLPKDHPTRTYSRAEPRRPNLSYENGVPVSRRPDGSAMPYLRADGEVMRQREFDRKAHAISDNRAKVAASASKPTN